MQQIHAENPHNLLLYLVTEKKKTNKKEHFYVKPLEF